MVLLEYFLFVLLINKSYKLYITLGFQFFLFSSFSNKILFSYNNFFKVSAFSYFLKYLFNKLIILK